MFAELYWIFNASLTDEEREMPITELLDKKIPGWKTR
jgi:hypothetical protein